MTIAKDLEFYDNTKHVLRAMVICNKACFFYKIYICHPRSCAIIIQKKNEKMKRIECLCTSHVYSLFPACCSEQADYVDQLSGHVDDCSVQHHHKQQEEYCAFLKMNYY